MKTESRLVSDYLSRSYSELQNMIRHADTKANIILVLIGVILSLFFNFFVSKNILPLWQIMIVLILFFISGFYALIALYPRTAQKNGKFSLLYYIDTQDSVEKIASGVINKKSHRTLALTSHSQFHFIIFYLLSKLNCSQAAGYFLSLQMDDDENRCKQRSIKPIWNNENREREILQDYIANIQTTSKIIDVKFKKLQISYAFFGLAIVLKVIFEAYSWDWILT
ncbi:MAG: hypothetical protein AABX16_02640 [Nanoarchaeota archaeon]